MMISPEQYYEKNLKGKSVSEILAKIRGLKNEIGFLKNRMESKLHFTEGIDPGFRIQLSCHRAYLEKAKEALLEAGGEYKPSQAERKAMDFEENIPYIQKIEFTIGGYFKGYTSVILTFYEDHMVAERSGFSFETLEKEEDDKKFPFEKNEFLNRLQTLYIGEWKSSYNIESVLDGIEWTLRIDFSNGHRSIKISGSNAYPNNFEEFCQLMGEKNWID